METRLAQLQAGRTDKGAPQLTARESAELQAFQQQRQRVRIELRDVQQQLNASIMRLGTHLKLIDILGMPLLLTLFALIIAWWRRRPQTGAL
jgi:ABC-type uncharacterized transport system involved in gliding motility auxiliary subunit